MSPTIRRAVIPAAGLGSRLLPLTKATPKEMLPVGDKPVIEHTVRELVDERDEGTANLVAGQRDQVVRRGSVCVFVGADDGVEGVGRHRRGDPAGPGGVAADLALAQPGLPW